ncbi:MAG: magnesium transporter [Gemmatales bacterium]|nr:magnesium transporter [Gemmatales bacterium]MDW8221800.1 magnesium transporter [Gemmatales bacterium]
MAHPLFTPEARQMLAENDVSAMKAFCEEVHPATVAETLCDGFEVEEVWRFLQTTDIRTQAQIFEYFPPEWQIRMVEGTGRQHMARLIEQMSHDDRVDLLQRLTPAVRESLLRLVDEADRRDIALLQSYAENTAGAIMTTDYAWVPARITVVEALERLRLQAPDSETIYYVYVLDEHHRLQGVVSLRDLILAPRHRLVEEVMERDLITVHANEDRESVAQKLAHYDLLAIPVVDDQKRMLGIVTYDDVLDVVVSEATEDVQKGAGLLPIENYLEAPFFYVWRRRVGWLACLFVAEMFTFTALAYFEDAISQIVVLAMFVPLCIATGGNSGSQAATLITRAIALQQVTVAQWWKVLRHELAMGVALGLALGVIGFARSYVVEWLDPKLLTVRTAQNAEPSPQSFSDSDVPSPDPQHSPRAAESTLHVLEGWRIGMVVGMAVAAICLWGTLVGSMLPVVFRALGLDPAFASSPFVATFVDVTGIVIYFNIARLWIPIL